MPVNLGPVHRPSVGNTNVATPSTPPAPQSPPPAPSPTPPADGYQSVQGGGGGSAQKPVAGKGSPPAEDFMEPLDRGFWVQGGKNKGVVKGYADFAVRNYEFHKAMAVKLRVTRQDGHVEEFLYRPQYKGPLPDGRERWGTDAVELFPDRGPHGPIKHVDMSYMVQADVDADGRKDLCQSRSTYRLASVAELRKPKGNMGAPAVSGDNPVFSAPADVGRARATSLSFKDAVPPVEVYFAPYDHPERALVAEMDTVIQAKRADPGGRHYIHASVFDINDPRLVDKLLEAHAAGVEVKLLSDASHMTPDKPWQTEYKRLQDAGVEVIGVVREGFAASNHTKFAIFDGKVASTGSYNWETRAADENCENLMVIRSPDVAAVYEDLFHQIGGGPAAGRAVDPTSKLNVYYSQENNVPAVIYRELEQAKESVVVTMFTLRSLTFQEDGQQKDVLDALRRAHDRGVKVTVVLEKNIADEGEYYGRKTANDPTDELLAQHGIEVVKIHTNFNNNQYAAMHHKFAVIDGQTTLTGAYNWYSGSQVSDDDLVVVRDPSIAQRYLGEVTNLRRHYDATFDPASVPSTPVELTVRHPHTQPGDTLYVVGDIPELGGWDPKNAIPLDGSGFPEWKVKVDVPAGTHFQYKLFVKNHWGRFWEAGENHSHTARPEGTADAVKSDFR